MRSVSKAESGCAIRASINVGYWGRVEVVGESKIQTRESEGPTAQLPPQPVKIAARLF